MARIFVFCGAAQMMGFPEWESTFTKINEPVVRFSDTNKFWYQEDKWNDILHEKIQIYGHPELCIGVSMGGWGALYYQTIIKAAKVLAFNPQTTTNVETMKKWGGQGNQNWIDDLKKFNSKGNVLPNASNTSATLFYGEDAQNSKTLKDDAGHKKLAEKLGYNIEIVPRTGHGAGISYYKETNQLIPLIKSYLS